MELLGWVESSVTTGCARLQLYTVEQEDSPTNRLLQHFTNTGLLHTAHWPFPLSTAQFRYHGQVTALLGRLHGLEHSYSDICKMKTFSCS